MCLRLAGAWMAEAAFSLLTFWVFTQRLFIPFTGKPLPLQNHSIKPLNLLAF